MCLLTIVGLGFIMILAGYDDLFVLCLMLVVW